ncbi:dephospho-CoA kinase [Bacillaceae bacterium]
MVAGLTGGIATGKSTVAEMFVRRGAVLIDADRIARLVVQPGKKAWRRIVERFGESVLLPSRELDRAALGEIVFRDPLARKDLEQITHPEIRREMLEQIGRAQANGDPLIIVDVPLLIERNMQAMFEKVILVYVDAETQLRRLMARNGLTEEQALRRISAQMPIEEKRKYADYIIDNRGTLEETERQVEAVYQKLVVPGADRCSP